MPTIRSDSYLAALNDFHHERHMASLQVVLGRLTGKPVDLLSFGEISQKLKLTGGFERGLKEIPVDAIVGSVGRYTDFTRTFLPRRDNDVERWARVKSLITSSQEGLPPIQVYQIGDVYFVRDGHHRVSVARQLHQKFIEAEVTEIVTKVPLTPDISPDALILEEEYVKFLEHTNIDRIIPGVEIRLTVPGLYGKLEEHIQVHRYYMGIEQRRDISLGEAVKDWYERVYLPVVWAIQERGILREFPGRTVADLYIWISEHRYLLEKELGWHIRSDVAAVDLADRMSPRPGRVFQRVRRRILDKILPQELMDVREPGEWQGLINPDTDCLFKDILIPISGEPVSWAALEQALVIAACPDSRLHGLHVVPTESQAESEASQAVKAEFETRCRQAKAAGSLAFVTGDVARQVVERALLTDLVVINLAHPPASPMMARLSSGFRTILRRTARPVLAVPGKASPLDRLLLAYDGSLKAKEALFVSAFMAGKKGTPLAVVTVSEVGKRSKTILQQARRYLDARHIQATYIEASGPVGEAVLQTCRDQGSNLILMGGYGYNPVLEAVLGSSIDSVLQNSDVPILICQ